MKRKKSIVILLVGITILVGGMYMRNFFTGEEITQEMLIQEQQERMALYLVNHYEDVKKIEFLSFEKNDVTGTWKSDIVVNSEYYITLHIDFLDKKSDIDITDHISRSAGKELALKEETTSLTLEGIEVIYIGGNKYDNG